MFKVCKHEYISIPPPPPPNYRSSHATVCDIAQIKVTKFVKKALILSMITVLFMICGPF